MADEDVSREQQAPGPGQKSCVTASDSPFPWPVFAAELIGTALLVLVGLSLVIVMFGEGSPQRSCPTKACDELSPGFYSARSAR